MISAELSNPKLAANVLEFLRGFLRHEKHPDLSMAEMIWWLPNMIKEHTSFKLEIQESKSRTLNTPHWRSFELNKAIIYIARTEIRMDLRHRKSTLPKNQHAYQGTIAKLVIEMTESAEMLEMQWFASSSLYCSDERLDHKIRKTYIPYTMHLEGNEKTFNNWLTTTKLML